MQVRILYLDKDDTLTQRKSGKQFVQSPWDQEPIKGVPETLAKWVSDGWTPIIVSNQQGVQYGHKSIEECFLEMRFALELFPVIKAAYFCPDAGSTCWSCWGDCKEPSRILYGPTHLGHSISYRKPGSGMLHLGNDVYQPSETFMVGDFESDEKAASQAGIRFQYIKDWIG